MREDMEEDDEDDDTEEEEEDGGEKDGAVKEAAAVATSMPAAALSVESPWRLSIQNTKKSENKNPYINTTDIE